MIRSRKKNWIGHILRGDGLLKEVMEGRMEGKRGRGRPRIGMLDELIVGSYGDMKRWQRTGSNGEIECHGSAGRQNSLSLSVFLSLRSLCLSVSLCLSLYLSIFLTRFISLSPFLVSEGYSY